jgi:hypothetical protein
MKLVSLTSAVALMALGLGGCERGGMVNSQICTEFKTPAAGQTAVPASGVVDAASPVDECVRRWAYSLAGSRDGADVVAGAAVAACGATLSRWNQTGLSQGPAAPGDQAVSLTTGEPTNAMAEHNAFAQARALLYVVEARAGHCAPPPATNGVPAGV